MTKDNRHPNPHHNEADKHERHIDGSIHVRGYIEGKRPPDLTEEHNTERDEDKASAKKKFVVEIITLAVVAIYAGLTGRQVCLMQSQFTKDQRPYVWVKGDVKDLVFDMDWQTKKGVPPIEWDVSAVNYGKTPALRAKMCSFVTVTDTPKTINEHLTEKDILTACNKASMENRTEGVIPQGEKMSTTDVPTHGYTPEFLKFLKNTDDSMALWGYITYEDREGNAYSSMYCGIRFSSGAIHFCADPKTNAIK